MLHDVHHVTVQVRDLDRACARYAGYGLVCLRRTSLRAWFCGATTLIELVVAAAPVTPAPPWFAVGIGHLCIQTPDSTTWVAQARSTDAQPRSAPVDLGTGHWYTYLDDRDGILTECEGVPYAPATLSPWVAHVAWVTPDLARITDFYAAVTGGAVQRGRRLAGIPAVDTVAGLHGVIAEPAWVSGCNIGLEFWQYEAPQSVRLTPATTQRLGYHGVAFAVADLIAAGTHLAACGATLGENAYTHSVWYDPDGNRITLSPANAPDLPTRSDPTRHLRVMAAR